MLVNKTSETENAKKERKTYASEGFKKNGPRAQAKQPQPKIANKTIVIGINGACNNDCIFCSSGGSLPSLDVSADKIIETLSPYPLNGATAILSGGEPTAHTELAKIIKYLRKRGCAVKMMTNARRFSDKKFAKKISDAGLNAITAEILSPYPEVHDFLTQRRGSFDETVQGIKNLGDCGVGQVLKIIVNRINCKTLPEIVTKICKTFPAVSEISISGMNPVGSAEKNMGLLGIRFQDCAKYVEQGIDTAESFGVAVRLYAIPICALNQKYAKYSVARKDFTYVNVGNGLKVTSKKYLAPRCAECRHNAECTGIWRKHILQFGDGEINPQERKTVPEKHPAPVQRTPV